MHKKFLIISLVITIVALSGLICETQDENFIRTYIDLPIQDHLWAAKIKLEQMIQTPAQPLDNEKRNQLQESLRILQDALKKYAYYLTQDEVLLTENWQSHFNMISQPGSPDISKSPLSLLAHLYIAYEAMMQRSANIMIQSIQYTEEETRLHKILDEAQSLAEKALDSAQQGIGRMVHSSGNYRFFLEIPSGYITRPSTMKWPIQTRKNLPDGSPQRVVNVEVLEAQHTIAPEAFVNARIAELKKKFTDLSEFKLEEARGDGYEIRALFSYTYTWEGDRIKALVYTHKSGQRAYEVSCLALADHFDREGFERIIRSFHRL